MRTRTAAALHRAPHRPWPLSHLHGHQALALSLVLPPECLCSALEPGSTGAGGGELRRRRARRRAPAFRLLGQGRHVGARGCYQRLQRRGVRLWRRGVWRGSLALSCEKGVATCCIESPACGTLFPIGPAVRILQLQTEDRKRSNTQPTCGVLKVVSQLIPLPLDL
jgi:hypothetical protein